MTFSPLSKSFLPQVFFNFTMTWCGFFIIHLWWALHSPFILITHTLPFWEISFYYLEKSSSVFSQFSLELILFECWFSWTPIIWVLVLLLFGVILLFFIYFPTIFLLVVASLFWENFLNFSFFVLMYSFLLAYFIFNPFCPLLWCGRDNYLAVWRGVWGATFSLTCTLTFGDCCLQFLNLPEVVLFDFFCFWAFIFVKWDYIS